MSNHDALLASLTDAGIANVKEWMGCGLDAADAFDRYVRETRLGPAVRRAVAAHFGLN